MAQTQAQVSENYLRLCDKYGWKKPGRWAPRPMAKGKVSREAAKEAKG